MRDFCGCEQAHEQNVLHVVSASSTPSTASSSDSSSLSLCKNGHRMKLNEVVSADFRLILSKISKNCDYSILQNSSKAIVAPNNHIQIFLKYFVYLTYPQATVRSEFKLDAYCR